MQYSGAGQQGPRKDTDSCPKMPRFDLDQLATNKKHLKNVGPIRHCEPPHRHSPGGVANVARRAACASMSTTTTTTRDRGDRYGPIEWTQ